MKLSGKKWPFKLKILLGGAVLAAVSVCGLMWYRLSAPMVSVVMSVYNGAQNGYLHRSIPSILNQSFRDFELIMVDDGSTDNSWELLKAYAARDHRIKLLKNDRNRGISYSRNRGNDAARGKYIMVMDQDDDNHPDRMKKQVAYMESQPWVTVSVVPARLYGWPVDATWIEDDIKLSLFFHNTIGHPNIMVKRQFLNDYKIRYNETIKCANDWDWLLQIRDNGGYFGVLFEKLFTYSGPRFSAGGIGKCQGEAEAIRKRFSDIQWSEKTDDAYFCDVIEMIQRTPKYERLFTEGYLVFKNKKCLKER